MRVIKQNTLRYESFYKLLPYLNGKNENNRSSNLLNEPGTPLISQLSKLRSIFENIFSFHKQINNLDEVQKIILVLDDSIKKILQSKEINIFQFEDSKLISLNDSGSEYSINFINDAYKKGILDWVFQDSNPKVIPDLKLYNIKGSKLNYLVFPLISDKKNKGILSILSSISGLSAESLENRVIQFMGASAFSRIELLKRTNELQSAYQDQQIYQSKLLNDYRLSAIGELTNGVVEEILSPLQVILSQVDFLRKENAEITETDYDTITAQVKKVENIVSRLVNFADINNENIKIYPCDLNKLIKDYYNLLSSTLKNLNYECYMDLADNLPHVLSYPDYIFQILANVFSFINYSQRNESDTAENNFKSRGGILIQSRFKDKKIIIRIVFTDNISGFKENSSFNPKQSSVDNILQYNYRIVNNLMKKHEGELVVSGNDLNGSVIVLSFPLQRKI